MAAPTEPDYELLAAMPEFRRDVDEWASTVLADACARDYRQRWPTSHFVDFAQNDAHYLFDFATAVQAPQADRTVLAWARSRPATAARDKSYQAGYPSPAGRAIRPLDKGHLVPHASGGAFGPNMYPQDRELNQGRSPQGRRFRALERELAASVGTFFFQRLRYVDDSDFPAWIDFGMRRGAALHVETFQNRFDI